MDARILPEFSELTLPVDTAAVLRCVRLRVPVPPASIGTRSSWRTALVRGMTAVTRNLPDFEPTGVPLLNPWMGTITAETYSHPPVPQMKTAAELSVALCVQRERPA